MSCPRQNRRALAALGVKDGDDVLELGYGHGKTVEAVAALTPSGSVAGIDHSGQMQELASRHCDARFGKGRVDLRSGDSRDLPYADGSFSRVLAMHVLYFWSDPLEHFRETHRVLREGGSLVMAFRDKRDPATANFPSPLYRFHETGTVRGLLAEAGFLRSETVDDSPGFTILRALR